MAAKELIPEMEVRKPQGTELAVSTPTPMDLLVIATNQGADVDKIAKLMDLQLRWEANEARKAFVVAMNAFKADPPEIIKNKLVQFKDVRYKHATLDQVCDAVTAALSKHGISHRWSIDEVDQWIKVTCILTHEQGHSETTALGGPPDQTGSKNALQARASTVTYLERYTHLAATGLAATDDGQGGATPEVVGKIEKAETFEALDVVFKEQFKAANGNTRAQVEIVAARDKRRGELRQAAPMQGVPLDWGKK